ncbi:hypothetical protein F511_24568 [Dorcoceras hygrometricum]|uniref:C2 NT-type domain-containing protein n=1 Tax=Dorcoceras hygrometricum TaxID=472368 RepID=A0A2Z7ATU3_9LAMI|nr:hypothetical protein F511_24568 [Dorcoceras hygrometricum]
MRREKKFEAIFKMQFQVTQVDPLTGTCLMISLVPVDAGKPTARLEKAKIVEGICTWEYPVYETVELVQEIKTGRIREKIYHMIVSTESWESGLLGQASIDFADLAEVKEPRIFTLPLQTSISGATLHVTVQRMLEDYDPRGTEDGKFLDTDARDSYSNTNGNLQSTQKLTADGENFERESKQKHSALQQNLEEKMDMEKNYIKSLATVKQLEFRVETLEEDIKKHQLLYSESRTLNEELEIQAEDLHKELENQAQLYEERLKATTEAKVNEEQRAVRAEEAFREAMRDNANTVERLQQEINEMSMKIEEYEKLAQKSVAEATDLQQKNEVLKSMVQNAEEEHQKTRTGYGRLVHEFEELKQLSDIMSLKIEETEKLAQKSIAEATDLRGKKEVLESLLQKAEQEQQILKTKLEITIDEFQERKKNELDDVDRQLASLREEVDKLKQEKLSMKSQVDLKNSKEVTLNLEVKKLRLKNSDLKNHLSQVEMEKADLKEEVATLQEGFHKNKAKNINASEPEAIGNCKNNSTMANQRVVNDVTNQIELDAAQIKSLLAEVEYMKERNKIMEEGLEEMHERYSEISLRFAEVEGERQQLIMTVRNLKSGKNY